MSKPMSKPPAAAIRMPFSNNGIDKVLNTFRSACNRMDGFPELTFSANPLQYGAGQRHAGGCDSTF